MAINLTVPDLPAPGSRDANRLEREFRTGASVGLVLKNLPALLRDDFAHSIGREKAGYRDRQAAIARAFAGEKRTVPGLGRMVASIDARTYFRWMQQDPAFWQDPENVRKFLQDNPECRVSGYAKTA